jgi:hypothetical protein
VKHHLSTFLASAVAFLLLTLTAVGSQSPPTLRGTWSAAIDSKRMLRGTWSAEVLPASSNAAKGSWTLLNEVNQIVLEGTWSATKSERSWNGAWSARIVPAGRSPAQSPSGRVVSGTFRADVDGSDAKSLAEMLQLTLKTQVAGAWRSGASQGRWSLKGAS